MLSPLENVPMAEPPLSRRTLVGFAGSVVFSVAIWSALILCLWGLRR
jgi:hypothetical protein